MKEGKKLNWQQACARLGCGKSKFYDLVNSGVIPAYRVGRRGIWVKEEDVAQLIRQVGEE